MGDKGLREERTQEIEREQKALVASAQAYNSLSMNLMMAGSAMMLFSRNEKTQRMGMILNASAALVQIFRTLSSAAATIVKVNALQQEIISEKIAGDAKKKNLIMDEMGMVAKYQAAAASKVAAFAMDKLALSTTAATRAASMFISVVTLGGFLLIAALIAGAFGKVKQSVDEATVSMVDMANVTAILQEELSLGAINSQLLEQEAIIKRTADATDGLAKQEHDNAVQRQLDLRNAKDSYGAQVKGLRDVILEIERQEEAINRQGKKAKATNYFLGKRTQERSKKFMQKDLKAYMATQEAILGLESGFFERTGIRTIEALEFFNKTTQNAIEQTTAEVGNSIISSLNEAEDEMYNFNNAREEMFYGFSTNRLTGDLVRQVHQQGVETLINTTEVIMNNNFNGLTIPEVADKIIEEIESRGNMLGYSIS